ncbi:MAG: CxxH/CxxC protein [Caryophanon sp.]|nr:CxxH/CxxC protein [Caryophanon sp.]
MEKYSCEQHIDHALDMFVAEEKVFPTMDFLTEEQKLSTTCSYCDEHAVYMVSR